MSHFFDPDTPLMRTLSTLFDLLVLSLLFLLCSIPLVTIGASLTALYGSCARLASGESAGAAEFFRLFRGRFKRSTLVWLAFWAAAVFLYLDGRVIALLPVPARIALWAGLFFLALCLLLAALLLFPLLDAQPQQPLLPLARRALFTAIARLPQSLLLLLLAALPFMVLLTSPTFFLSLSFLWLFFWPGLVTYFHVRLMGRFICPERFD